MTDTNYVNVLYIFIAKGYSGKLSGNSDEGEIQWMDINEFLHHPDLVDHISYYLLEIISPDNNFYSGIGIYVNHELVEYSDNKSHFSERTHIK